MYVVYISCKFMITTKKTQKLINTGGQRAGLNGHFYNVELLYKRSLENKHVHNMQHGARKIM